MVNDCFIFEPQSHPIVAATLQLKSRCRFWHFDIITRPPRVQAATHAPGCCAHLHGADGVSDDGSLAVEVKADVHAGQGGQDVAEQHDAIGLECAPGLQGDLNLQSVVKGGGRGVRS